MGLRIDQIESRIVVKLDNFCRNRGACESFAKLFSLILITLFSCQRSLARGHITIGSCIKTISTSLFASLSFFIVIKLFPLLFSTNALFPSFYLFLSLSFSSSLFSLFRALFSHPLTLSISLSLSNFFLSRIFRIYYLHVYGFLTASYYLSNVFPFRSSLSVNFLCGCFFHLMLNSE